MKGVLALQTAIFNKLVAQGSLTTLLATFGGAPAIFDAPPQENDAGDNADYPYLSIGYINAVPWDTDTSTGADAIVTVHTWTRGANFAPAHAIMAQVYEALHRQELSVSGYTFAGCDIDQTEISRDPDGETVHGVQRFRIIYE